MNPTAQQQDFLDKLINTSSNLALVARAGCGKTSTILMGVEALVEKNPNLSIAICAFNKAISVEIKEKLMNVDGTPRYDWRQVQVGTLHSLGFSLVRPAFQPTVDANKVRTIIKNQAISNPDMYGEFGGYIEAMVRCAKSAGFGFEYDIEDIQAWEEILDHFGIDYFDKPELIEAAKYIYKLSLEQTNVIDFDDMILFPLYYKMKVGYPKDILFLDEAQDLSKTRQALAKMFVRKGTKTKPAGRMIVVGDDRQAIYGFSGADAEALDNLTKDLKAIKLPLSVTWRCPQEVVKLANTIVDDIEAAPNAKAGSVTTIKQLEFFDKDGHALLRPSDAILCRNTAPLISTAYSLIRNSIACKVEGRAIGEGLIKLCNRWKVKNTSVLNERLDTYQQREVEKALAKDNELRAEQIQDQVSTLKIIIDACNEKKQHNVSDVIAFINNLFADDVRNTLTLCTYHRSKGREWPRVYLITHNKLCPSKAAKKDWQRLQEQNLAYVAFTRAQEELIFVGS